jgi:hypothetical protein
MTDGGSKINIITKNLRVQLGLLKPNPMFYNLHMVNQTIAKPLGLIRNLKILIHGIPYMVTFTVINNNVLDSNYSMLLGCPWLRYAKVSHDWGTNIVTIQKTGIVKPYMLLKNLVFKPKDYKF